MKKALLMILSGALLFVAGGVLGCHYGSGRTHTRTFIGSDGRIMREVTCRYPLRGFSGESLPWWKCQHGWDVFYDQDGKVEAKGEWRGGLRVGGGAPSADR